MSGRQRSALLFSLGTGLALLLRSPDPATAQLLGPEFQVNSFTTGIQQFPAVAADRDGDFVVIWTGEHWPSPVPIVLGQLFDSAGAPSGREFQVNGPTLSPWPFPVVASGDEGNFVVIMRGQLLPDSVLRVYGQRFDPSGRPMGGIVQVSGSTSGTSPDHVAVAAGPAGNFAVVWDSWLQDGSQAGVRGRVFDSEGNPIGSEFQVNDYTKGSQYHPDIAMDADGNFVVVWASLGQNTNQSGVFGRRFGADGVARGAEFQVNSLLMSPTAWRPEVAADDRGNFVVVWGKPASTGSSLAGRRFSSTGEAIGGEFQVNTNEAASAGDADVAMEGLGSFLAVWASSYAVGPEREVSGRRFSPAADPLGDEFQINVYTNDSQRAPAVATGGTGDSVVAWMSNWQDGSGEGIFGRQITPSIFRHAFESTPPFWSATTASTCSGYCATNSTPDGVCYCDELCLTLFDCCLDACLTCGQCVP